MFVGSASRRGRIADAFEIGEDMAERNGVRSKPRLEDLIGGRATHRHGRKTHEREQVTYCGRCTGRIR